MENTTTEMFKNMEKMMQMMRLMSVVKGETSGKMVQESSESIVPFAPFGVGSFPELDAVKSAINALEPSYRRSMNAVVKMIEIQKLLEVYNRHIAEIGQDGDETSMDWQRFMTTVLLSRLPAEKQAQFNMLLQMVEMKGEIA